MRNSLNPPSGSTPDTTYRLARGENNDRCIGRTNPYAPAVQRRTFTGGSMTRKEREKEGREKWFRDSQFFIDAVREGREVEGFWEGKLMRGVAEGFRLDGPWPFLIGRTWTNNARPIPQKLRRYLGPVDMMRWLVEHGYKPNYEGGWTCYGNCPFSPAMWQYCDTPEVEGDHGYSYHIEWIVGMYE